MMGAEREGSKVKICRDAAANALNGSAPGDRDEQLPNRERR